MVDDNSESDDEALRHFFEAQVDNNVKVTLKTTFNPKVVSAVKSFQAFYNDDANKIVNKMAQEKRSKKIKSFNWSS